MKRVMFATLLAACTAGAAAAQQPGGQPAAPAPSRSMAQDTTRSQAGQSAMNLGTVRITRKVTADGKPLAPGSYQVRLTADEARPEAAGTDPKLERWVEFTRGGRVQGREVVSIVPQAEIGQVAEGRPPRPGGSKVELLKGNDYLRVWINRGGTHYLIHLPTAS